jgi:hypothetical protein
MTHGDLPPSQARKVRPVARNGEPSALAATGRGTGKVTLSGRAQGSGDAMTGSEDIRDQGVTLMHVLHRYPTLLTIPVLVREITSGPEDFGEGDNVERAVCDLTAVGLLHCTGGLVAPSPAALRFLQILQEGAS